MIDTRFWNDVWVVDRLNPLDRYLMLYFLTNNKTNIAGVYEISLKTVANETGLDRDEILKMVHRLEPRVRYIEGWVILQNFIKNQNYKSPKIKNGIEYELENVPPRLLRYLHLPNDWIPAVVKRETENLPLDLDTVSIPLEEVSHSNTNSNTNLNSNSNNIPAKKSPPKTKIVDKNFEEISKLYFEVIKTYKLPVLNHNTIRAKIKQMTTEADFDKIKGYLLFLRDQYQKVEIDYKPHINNALDIYSKRVQIENAIRSAAKEQQQNKVFRV